MHRHRSPQNVPATRRRVLSVELFALGVLGLGVLGLGVGSSAGCDTNSLPGESYEIVGFVVEAQGTGDEGPPIPNATVRFENDTGRSVEGVTESNGHFRLFIFSETRFGELSASAAGYQTGRATVFFDTASRRVDLALPRDASAAP